MAVPVLFYCTHRNRIRNIQYLNYKQCTQASLSLKRDFFQQTLSRKRDIIECKKVGIYVYVETKIRNNILNIIYNNKWKRKILYYYYIYIHTYINKYTYIYKYTIKPLINSVPLVSS